jgi:hypothetical protein
MSVLVRVGRKKAILCSGRWSCADTRLEEQLQAALDIWVQKTGGPPMGDTDPDQYAAEALSAEMCYEVVLSNKPKRKATVARRAYFHKRQFTLPFL